MRRRVRRPGPRRAAPHLVALGDLLLDVVVAPQRSVERGTDVPGTITFRRGGSAANTSAAFARSGGTASLITSLGSDPWARRLVSSLGDDGVRVHAVRSDGPSGRLAAIVDARGERSFITQRGVADSLRATDIKASWFRRTDALHVPAYSLFAEPIGAASLEAARLAREAGLLISSDLSSRGPLESYGIGKSMAQLRSLGPDVLFANRDEAAALLGQSGMRAWSRLLELAPLVVVKDGAAGCRVLHRPVAAETAEAVAPLASSLTTVSCTRCSRADLRTRVAPHGRRRRCARPRWPATAPRPLRSGAGDPRSASADATRYDSYIVTTPADFLEIAPEVKQALDSGRPVVALESTLITHGLPHPDNLAAARRSEAAVRAAGAVPATVALRSGRIKVGLSDGELEELARVRDVPKVSRQHLAGTLAVDGWAGTTVSATMICADRAGIRVFATGGIGGVHRGGEDSLDISADLEELSRTAVAVVCAGPKSILDVGRTLEVLETRGVPVAAWQSDEVAGFHSRSSGHRAPLRVEDAEEAAALIDRQRDLGLGGGVLITVPLPHEAALPRDEILAAVERASADADEAGIAGPASTPWILSRVAELTGGRSIVANIALIAHDSAIAGAIAVVLARSG